MTGVILVLAVCLGSPVSSQPDQQTLLVDLRGQASFQRIHIPGSINMPLHQLKAKTWLRNKPILLIGHTGQDLSQQLATLEKLGFLDVAIKAGGLYGHLLAGHSLVGGSQDIFQLGSLDAAHFLSASRDTPWIKVALAGNDLVDDDYVRLGETDEDLDRQLQDLASAHPEARLLLVDRNGEMKDRILPMLHQIKHEGMFYLNGGQKQLAQLAQAGTAGRLQKSASSPRPIRQQKQASKSCGCGKK